MPSQSRRIRSILRAALVVALTRAGVWGDPPPEAAPPKPAEESRLGTAAFRAGLKQRGLTELLELHLSDFPPSSDTEALIMMREVKLTQFADPTLPAAQRRASLTDANRILQRLIDQHRNDPRRFMWRFTLARSLLYDEAEPFTTSILYRGGSGQDRKRLASLAGRAVSALKGLVTGLAKEYDKIDKMSIREFEKLEAQGYIEQLDGLAPRSEYLLLWALLYDSLWRDDGDPVRAGQLNEIIDRVSGNPQLLNTPHETSHVQVQALLLTGMTHRLLNNHRPAREHLDRALLVAGALDDSAEQNRIKWAVTLSWLERVRNAADAGRFDDALRQLTHFRAAISPAQEDTFGLTVVPVLLERWVYLRRAAAAENDDRLTEAEQYRHEAWKVLQRQAKKDPRCRNELYAALYELFGPEADAGRLDPFEKCALIAGLLMEADQTPDASATLLDRVVGVGERFLAQADPATRSLVPEVLYNLGVAQYRQGRLAAAAERFLEVARDHGELGNAPKAATYAVQLAAELYRDPSMHDHPLILGLYREALHVLITDYRNTAAARYWRFYYAQLLEELEEYDKAATQYALVDRTHEHFVESVFFRARCLAMALQRLPIDQTADRISLQHRVDDFVTAGREFVSLATSELRRDPDPQRAATVKSLLARSRLLVAEVDVLPYVERPARALETLTGFEEDYSAEGALAGRIWRARVMAYEKLGRFDEATRAIPEYVAAAPDSAATVLQSLYGFLAQDIEELQAKGDTASAAHKAEMALVLARTIHESSASSSGGAAAARQRALVVQLAEANLHAARYARAFELLDPLLATGDGSPGHTQFVDSRVLIGHAEASFQLGKFATALPEFNRLATGLPPSDPVRWKALLRDLQCRAALGHEPRDIIKVIKQQEQLFPKLGGPILAPQFEKLKRESERRLDGGR